MRRRSPRRPNPPLDTGAMGRAFRGEIDTRVWAAYGNVVEDPVTDDYGYRVDVEVFTDAIQVVTARVWTPYAGPGFGLFARIYKDDEVLVVFPGGDINEAVVMPGFWSASARQPTLANGTPDEDDAAIAPDDWLLILKPGTKMRIEASGADLELVTDQTVKVQAPHVELGTDPTEKAVLGDALSTWLTSTLSVSTPFGPSGPAVSGLTSNQLSAVVKVK